MRFSFLLVVAAGFAAAQSRVGIFEGRADVGDVLTAGRVSYDADSKSYAIDASGENMWFAKDEFHFVWKKVSADFRLEADISFPTSGGNAHKKAVLMARQSLAADSAYADVAVHGDGLTSLQARDESGANTHEVGINAAKPVRVRLEKRGEYFYMYLATAAGEPLRFSGASMRVQLKAPFYVGIGVCAHDKNAVERAVFSNVLLSEGSSTRRTTLWSTVETISVASTDRRVVWTEPARLENIVWSAESGLVFNRGTGLFRVPATGKMAPVAVQPGERVGWVGSAASPKGPKDEALCEPHISPDEKLIAFLAGACAPEDRDVALQVWSVANENVRTLARFTGGAGTLKGWPWSADGKSLAFVSYHQVPE